MELPKGYLIAIGGAEKKGGADNEERDDGLFDDDSILKNIVEIIQQQNQPVKVGLVTTASRRPADVAKPYDEAFQKFNIPFEHFNIATREQAESREMLAKLTDCSCIYFSGGDQLRLCSILGGTEFLNEIKTRYHSEPFILAGTSAGAMALSRIMIYGGNAAKAHLKGEVKISIGFGFIENVIIDTHFDARGRFNRLVQVVASQPAMLGIGLGEDTAIIVQNETDLRVVGSGCVTIIDGKNICYTNVGEVANEEAISVKNIQVHLLCNKDQYPLRKILMPPQ
ncbi:MAG: cyanophycinase [Chitinophagaceae bacterium]|nr:cyanophycinase [Chitinophagaceae bacterium]